ncbi:MAG: hypothetical protein ILO34_02060, partial [Kiritimatiellae bacterium]|nr:hypothetical protein [Kiritimatiellia bacterium]
GGGSGHAASGSGGSGIGGDGGSGENYGSGHPGVDGTGSGGGGSFFWSDGYRGYEFGGDGGSGVVVVRIESDVYDNVADIRHVSSSVNGISATFDWYLLGAGSGESATVCLEYGFTEGLYISSVVLDAAADPGAGSATLACFSEGTVYHARLTATGDGEDDIAGATGDFTFTTGDISGYSALVDIGLVIRRGASASAMAYFDESLAGADLYVAAGSSADMADGWPATALESIGVAETSRQIDFAIGAGDGFFRLLAVLGETVYASRIVSIGDATTIDESAPYFATDFTLDGSAGDAISVHGVLESAGAGDSAAVSVEYSTTPSFSVFRSVPAGNHGSGDSVDVVLYSDDTESADYICPDTTYFVRLRADAGGGASVYSPVLQVHTFGASVLESSVAVTAVEQTVFEAVADITQIGAGGSATVVFLVGPDRNSLVEVWSQQVSRPGQVAFYYTNSVFGTVYVQARVDNSCSTAEFSAASATGSVSLADTTAWYWVGQSGGNWSDSANWANSWGTPGVNVGNCPNSGNVPVYFDRAGASPRVVVDGAYTVGRLVPAAISNVVELVGSEGAQIHIYSNLGYEEQIASYGSTIVYRDISVYYDGTNPYIPSGCAMKLYNTFLTAGYLFMHGADAAFEAYDESYVQITYQYLQIAGAGCRVVVDDSTIQFSNYWNDTTIYCAGANCTLVFAGTHPQIATPHNFGIQAAGVRFVFELPAGGYTRPPILCTGSPYGAPFYYSNADCIPTIEIAADSTYKSGKSFTCTLIDSSNCNGYASDGSAGIYEGLNLVSPSSSISFSYAYQDGTATPGTGTVPNTEIPWPGGVEPLPKFLRVSYNNAGMALFIR